MLKLSKCKTRIKRRIPFKFNKIDTKAMENSTIYIENFPATMDQLDMAVLFQRAGAIRNLSMPSFRDKQWKGFCFIEFASAECAQKACQILNNVVPEEFTN